MVAVVGDAVAAVGDVFVGDVLFVGGDSKIPRKREIIRTKQFHQLSRRRQLGCQSHTLAFPPTKGGESRGCLQWHWYISSNNGRLR